MSTLIDGLSFSRHTNKIHKEAAAANRHARDINRVFELNIELFNVL